MKRFSVGLSAALAAVIILSSLPASAAGGAGVTLNVKTPGGKQVNLVTVDFTPQNRKPVLLTAAGQVTTDTAAANFIATAEKMGTLVAMVNAAYFNSYYNANAARTYPGNTALTQGLLVTGGRAIVNGGSILLGYSSDGKWLIDKVSTALNFHVDGQYRHTAWGVNNYYTDTNAINLYTPEVGMAVPMPAGAKGYIVRGGVVAEVVTSSFTPAAGETVIVIGAGAQAGMDTWDLGPKIGSRITFSNVFTPSRPERAGDWENIELAVGAGPLLLLGGKNVSEDSGLNSSFQSDAKHKGVAQRTFIGIKPDNSIVIGEGSCTYSDAAETLKAAGCVDAMALDGGASSFLHANGATVQAAGRKLNNVLAIIDTGGAVTPTPVPAQPSGKTAKPSPQKILVNGEEVTFDVYHIDGNNYFRLRDIAHKLSGTEKEFEVGYDNATGLITLTRGMPYTTVGGEMPVPGKTDADAVPSGSQVVVDGEQIGFAAYTIGGNNFFKLRELGRALDFGVFYETWTDTVVIRTDTGYIEE